MTFYKQSAIFKILENQQIHSVVSFKNGKATQKIIYVGQDFWR